MRAFLILIVACGLTAACEKNGASSGPSAPGQGASQPGKGTPPADKSDAGSPNEEQIVPPPDKPGYAPLD